MRSFKITHVTTSTGRVKGEENLKGYYKSLTPVAAAKKAFTKICGKSKIKGVCTLIVTISECSRGSACKSYTYKIKRSKKVTTVIRDGTPVTYKYVVKAVAVKKK